MNHWTTFDPAALDVPLRPGDHLGVSGSGWLSRRIRKATTDPGEPPSRASHVDMVVGHGTVLTAPIVGAAGGRVRRTTAAAAYGPPEPSGLAVMRPLNIPEEALLEIVRAVESRLGERYGYGDIALHALDRVVGGRFFRRLVTWKRPICSVLLASEMQRRGWSYGVPVGAAAPDDIDDFALEHPEKYSWPLGAEYRVLPEIDLAEWAHG